MRKLIAVLTQEEGVLHINTDIKLLFSSAVRSRPCVSQWDYLASNELTR
jgi:hypothetical protein